MVKGGHRLSTLILFLLGFTMLVGIALALMGVSWFLGYLFHRAISLPRSEGRKSFKTAFIAAFATLSLSILVAIAATENKEKLEVGDTAKVLAVYERGHVTHFLVETAAGQELKLRQADLYGNDWRGVRPGDTIALTENGTFKKCGY